MKPGFLIRCPNCGNEYCSDDDRFFYETLVRKSAALRKLQHERKHLLNGLRDLLAFYSRPDQCRANIRDAGAAVKLKRAARVAIDGAEKSMPGNL